MKIGTSQGRQSGRGSSRHSQTSTQVVSPFDFEDWNCDLRAFPDATIFHSRQWAAALHQTYSYKPYYLRDIGTRTAPLLLPAMETPSWLVGQRGISLPFTDECGALQSGSDAMTDLLGEVKKIRASDRWRSWEYRGGTVGMANASIAQTYFGHQLEIGAEPEELLARFDGTVRTSLNKARKLEVVTTTVNGIEAMQVFHRHLCETRRRHGLPPQPFRFFAEIERELVAAGLGFVVVAVHRGVPAASAVFLHFAEKAVYKFAASDFRFRMLQANHAVLWHGIQECARRGCRVLDFGRTSRSNSGLRQFKLAWRPRERTIDYVKYDLRRNRYVEAERELTTGWHNRLFRLLPLPISKALGALAYRHFA